MILVNKKTLLLNFLSIIIYVFFMAINTFGLNLVQELILLLSSYVIFFLYCKKKLGSFKYLLSSPAFIYGTIFVPYVALAIVMFIIDGYVPRIYYYSFNKETMVITTRFYIYIYLITLVLFSIFNLVKIIDLKEEMLKKFNKVKVFFSSINVIDIVAFVLAIYNFINVAKYGFSFFSLTTTQKRSITNNEISHYANLMMVVYSLMISYYYIARGNIKIRQKSNKKSLAFRLLICILYWGIFLTCERRIFTTFLIGLVILASTNIKKIRMKYVVLILAVTSLLLVSASLRGNVTLKNSEPKNVLYMSLTEFYLTYSISNYYVYNIDNIDTINGSSYFKATFLSLFPKFIATNKPKELAYQFYKNMKTNTGYSFNPVAEGILNYRYSAIIIVPILISLVVLIANLAVKFNFLGTIIIMIYSLDFYRGQFSNFFFDCVYCFVFLFLIFNINYVSTRKKGYKNASDK